MTPTNARRSRLEELRGESAIIEDDIRALRARVEELEAQIDVKKGLLAAKHKDMAELAPVYTLPHDVVSEILKAAFLHHFPYCRFDDGLPHTNSPVAISHVSRWWRKQALSVPAIWKCIHVTQHQQDSYAEIVKAYLIRSNNLPLSVSFQCVMDDDYDGKRWHELKTLKWTRYKASWKCLLTQRHRWQNLSLHFFYREAARLVLKTISSTSFSLDEKKGLPLLEFFNVSLNDSSASEPLTDSLQLVPMPKLKHLRVNGITDVVNAPYRFWEDLTEMVLHNFNTTANNLVSALRNSSETLTTLTLSSVFVVLGGESLHRLPPLILSKLTTLIIDDFDGHDLAEQDVLLALLLRAAPALETLSIPRFNTLAHRLLASGNLILPTLRTLNIPSMRYKELIEESEARRRCMQALPGLENLHMYADGACPLLEEAMAVDRELGPDMCAAWPNLYQLVVDEVTDAQAAVLTAFVEHRAAVGSPLRKLIIETNPCTLSLNTLKIFKAAQLETLQLSESPEMDQALYPSESLYWNYDFEGPDYVPWGGSWYLQDQFD